MREHFYTYPTVVELPPRWATTGTRERPPAPSHFRAESQPQVRAAASVSR
jgi:hypothetical protein